VRKNRALLPMEASDLVPLLEAEARAALGVLPGRGHRGLDKRTAKFRLEVVPTLRALEAAGWRLAAAARRLGMSHQGLTSRVQRYERHGWIRRCPDGTWEAT